MSRARASSGRPESAALSGLRVLLTGGSSGIGAATAAVLSAGGARLVISGRSAAGLERVGAAASAHTIRGDLTSPGFPSELVDRAAYHLGGLDTTISCAGKGWAGPFGEMSQPEIEDLIRVNLIAPTLLAKASLPLLARSSRGQLVLVGSVAGALGVRGEACYSSTKAGLAGLAESLRSEVRRSGTVVTLVMPGVADTPFFSRRNRPYQRAHPRPMPPERAAAAIAESIEHRSDEVVVPGWLALPIRVNGALPRLYRALESRFG